ncbi:carbonic anhydrase [Corynebacterium pseudodiphtheriticum]|uniref:carbonic anhydrase n=1 Tax=Corynebacterium pseudodiphtheriticum TaxID=37637 RepID=UPI0020BFDE60|nr:carbonic anhydrase [Corynebacterium pseudodiphtheriticum]MDK8564026.1 carbonic anhydrase [Corynebacterium pseudodiphtheriticum]MDK8686326.1 carbonic anhydrase [Corynebacterium pseudodiphtheriticum]MDK8718497.1 carbonic anhydrase [Corynebacterium pseudodiphtheriticum]UQV55096.1 carbonic anhydrase [Corynebacterium pseudodiphtheriticum]UQV57156.1 carbonic anhydrase [Corynebacterium pseudodiphtheriticum]
MQNVAKTPQAVWEALREGNERFIANRSERPNQDPEYRSLLSVGQSPRVVIFSCSDSRVPVEMVFDLGLGDAFVIRTAGQIIDSSIIASVEYAIEKFDVNLLVVMGHESCGAVRATMEFAEGGSAPNGFQRTIVERVLMSVTEANKRGLVTREDVERQHITETVYQLMARAPGLGQGLIRQSMGIVGLRYNLSEGRVEPVVLNGVH